MKIINKNYGFTLVELLVYISTAGIVILIITSLIFMLMQSKSKSSAIAEVEQQGNYAMDTIIQTIKNAENINSPSQGVADNSLEIDVVDSLADPTTFDVSNEILRITEGAGSPINLTSPDLAVSDIEFQNLSRDDTPGNIRIKFTLTKESNNRGSFFYQKTFYSSVSIR